MKLAINMPTIVNGRTSSNEVCVVFALIHLEVGTYFDRNMRAINIIVIESKAFRRFFNFTSC
jgi:hypothetical protein